MTQYVKCVKNDTYFQDDLAESFIELKIGAVYKVWPFNPETDIEGMVRVRGEFPNEPGSEEGYLYPVDYFEPFIPDIKEQATATATVHLPPDLRNILRAEVLAAGKSISTLRRGWIDERLDLPEHVAI
jgi:hypothetical protein